MLGVHFQSFLEIVIIKIASEQIQTYTAGILIRRLNYDAKSPDSV